MASQAFVPMGLWDKHSNGVLALIARIRTLSAQLAEAEKYNGWHQEALLVRDAALERAEKAEGERDNARAECSWLAKRLLHERSLLSSIAQDVEDEGGRVYFGRTNDADALKDFVDEIENYDFDRITRESKWPDYIETSRLAHERAAAAERERDELRAEVERLREKVERLTKALEPFAKAASDYERKGEFFSNNVELVLRVSVFAAPEYHNSTAVQVGDLRRARSELESGHE
jgi:archaellum component FlaC